MVMMVKLQGRGAERGGRWTSGPLGTRMRGMGPHLLRASCLAWGHCPSITPLGSHKSTHLQASTPRRSFAVTAPHLQICQHLRGKGPRGHANGATSEKSGVMRLRSVGLALGAARMTGPALCEENLKSREPCSHGHYEATHGC
jgi:hypothetical protein